MQFKLKKFTLVLGTLLFISENFAQVKISELLQNSDYHSPTSKSKLFMIEFWATWCGPCITVSDYLDVLQEQFKDDLFILSLSEETSATVQKFLTKRPTRLASSIDYDGQTFKKYGVTDLPFAVLFDASARPIWQGNPANLSVRDLERFIRNSSGHFDPNTFIDLEPYELESEYPHTLDGTYKLYDSESDFSAGITIFRTPNFIKIEGSLKYILSFLLKSSPEQIVLDEKNNKMYVLELQYEKELIQVTKKIIKVLGLKLKKSTKKVSTLTLNCIDCEDKFWPKSQIDWGSDSPQFLVDDIQFSADNSSLSDFTYQLSSLLKTPVIVGFKIKNDHEEFDWQLHYKFYDLMVDDLLFNFGIGVQKAEQEVPFYSIQKR